jgi:aromatic ring-opening dioxygenase LigB subunit
MYRTGGSNAILPILAIPLTFLKTFKIVSLTQSRATASGS